MENAIEVGEVQVERLDDIPAIFGHLQKTRIQATIDQVIETHGNWQGQSPGWVVTIWLIHILSEHTHCMDRVQDWVAKRLYTLQKLTGQMVTELDFTDDALKAIAKRAIQRKTGARGLRSILEDILLDTMFELPGMKNVTKVVVNEEAVTSDAQPLIIYADAGKESASAG